MRRPRRVVTVGRPGADGLGLDLDTDFSRGQGRVPDEQDDFRMNVDDGTEKGATIAEISQDVASLATAAVEQIQGASSLEDLDKLRVQFLGKQSRISQLAKGVGKLPREDRPAFGEAVNSAKQRMEEALG